MLAQAGQTEESCKREISAMLMYYYGGFHGDLTGTVIALFAKNKVNTTTSSEYVLG